MSADKSAWWDKFYKAKIEAEWNALPTVKTRLRGKLDLETGQYQTPGR